MFGKWMKLAVETSMLALESQQVIGLRLLKLSFGGTTASREANRMVDEKVKAFGEAAANVATGGTTRFSGEKLPEEGSGQSPPFDKVIISFQSSVRQDRKVPAACGTRRTFGSSARQRQLIADANIRCAAK